MTCNAMDDTSDGELPVLSRKEAMEWSLVLVSQGIEATIQAPDDAHGWQLSIPREDLDRAKRILALYQAENQRTLWQQPLPGTGLLLDWRAAGWCAVLAILFWMEQTHWPQLRSTGLMDVAAVEKGEWWRLFTAVMLHMDLGHLAANISTGLLLIGLAMGAYGHGWAFVAAYLAGAGGNLAGLLLYEAPHRSLGASGMVMGALGLLAVHSLSEWRLALNGRRFVLRGLLGAVLLLVLFGLNPRTDVLAHVGGFVSGIILGLALQFLPSTWRRHVWLNRGVEVLAVGLILLTWWLAFR